VCEVVGEFKEGVDEEIPGGGKASRQFGGTKQLGLPAEFLGASK
jgi:hypothetical protein